MAKYRLRNQNNLDKTLTMNSQTWYGILVLAEDFGWNPIGTAPARHQHEMGYGHYPGYDLEIIGQPNWGFPYDAEQIVLFEDALNLADALERAFLEYIPKRLSDYGKPYHTNRDHFSWPHPSIGAIVLTIEISRLGAFAIEMV